MGSHWVLMPVERASGSSLEAKERPADLSEIIAIVLFAQKGVGWRGRGRASCQGDRLYRLHHQPTRCGDEEEGVLGCPLGF